MGIEIYKHGMLKNENGFVASSKVWQEGTRYRKQINLDDSAVTRYSNLVIIDMSTWTGFTARADNTNYVRVYEHLDADESGVEINCQTIDPTWAGGNHTAVCFLNTQTDTKSTFTIYYGDDDLGATGYTSDLVVTADAPAAGDFTVQQNDFYKTTIVKLQGGTIYNFWTRVSGGDIQIGVINSAFPKSFIVYGGTEYATVNEQTPTITEVEGTTGVNAGAVLVAFKVTGVLEDVAHNPAQDDSAGNITYENIYVFCDCQLIYVKNLIVLSDTRTNTTHFTLNYSIPFINGYFSHFSYKFTGTHWVGIAADKNLDANYDDKLYACIFDITSNDGVATHYIDESLPSHGLEDEYWGILEDPTQELINIYHDYSGNNDVYTAGTNYMEFWIQCDDFTEADGDNDTDGDQPAHRKNTELLTALTQSTTEDVVF